jgi:hypothetical protein
MNISSDYSSASALLRPLASEANSATDKTKAAQTRSGSSYAQELQSKFPDLNLSTGEYSGGKTGSGVQGNVLISPKYLEKAASDPQVAAELEESLSGIPDAEEWLKNQCEMNGMTLVASGTIIDEDGNMSGWSETISSSGSPEDDAAEEKRVEKQREKKDEEEKRAEEKQAERRQDALEYSAYLTNYSGLYETPVSTTEIPFSFECYA